MILTAMQPLCCSLATQAVVNEDTDGDRAALKREIKRLNEELAAVRRQLATGAHHHYLGATPAGGSGSHAGAAGEPLSGTPARLHAQAEALLAATSPSTGQEVRGECAGRHCVCTSKGAVSHALGDLISWPWVQRRASMRAPTHPPATRPQGLARRQALVGALRREDAAVKEVKRLEGELEGLRGLLKVGGGWVPVGVAGGRLAAFMLVAARDKVASRPDCLLRSAGRCAGHLPFVPAPPCPPPPTARPRRATCSAP